MMLLQDQIIDYSLLAKAVDFYKTLGYLQVEVPWIVDEAASLVSSPTGDKGIAYTVDNGDVLVCSAEQGFISDHINKRKDFSSHNLTEAGYTSKYFSVSPCFRNEVLDDTHSKWFMKLELFAVATTKEYAAHRQVSFVFDALAFFERCGVPATFITTDIGHDINHTQSGLELGSYGFREVDGTFLVYGTGVALPRLSLVGGK